MPNKYALIIGNTEYADPGLAKLNAPGRDAENFARVLKSPELAAFDEVVTFINESAFTLNEAIEGFFTDKKSDDLLVFYFSGHGVRDEAGSLFLAVENTNRSRLRSTAIKAEFVRDLMDQSRSRRQVIILDCCNSGAFAYGTKAETGGAMGIATTFEGTGYGRVVLTATDSTQFAWEGDKIIGDETTNSLFTHFLVKGLEGEADEDGDGKITVDELYDYAYEQIVSRTPKQTPGKWSYKQQGEIVLRQSMRMKDIKPIPLPADLIAATENTIPFVREGAVKQLESLLKGRNIGLAHSAKEALEKIAQEDDSRRIAQLAAQALADVGQVSNLMNLPDEIAKRKAEKDRLAQAKVEAERKAKKEAERLEAAEKAKRENEKRLIPQKAEVKKPAVNSFPIALGGLGLLLIVGIFIAGIFFVSKWLSPSAALGIGSTMISDKDGMTLLYVPAGKFTMGDKAEDALTECKKYRSDCQLSWFKDEEPLHEVDLSAFWIDQTKVTNAMYAKCVDAGKCAPPSSTDHFSNSSYANHPIVYVNWNKASAYCSWAERRLPTEAEWEKAARGTDGRTYPWGNDSPNKGLLNYANNVGDTTEVGSYESGKSPYGAYDMAGNVWEWVSDWYDVYPGGDKNASSDFGQKYRVLRGGSWDVNDYYVRSAYRDRSSPGNTLNYVGFRCARGTSP